MSELARALAGLSGEERADQFFGHNRQRTSTRSGILKSDAVAYFAEALVDAGIEGFSDLHDANRIAQAEEAIMRIPGQRSGLSFKYFLMLGGDEDGVKADRMIREFVTAAARKDPNVSASAAEAAIVAACGILKSEFPNLTPRLLDHLVWKYQRGLKNSAGRKRACAGPLPKSCYDGRRERA